MKKLIGIILATVLLSVPVAMADNGSGCGLGKQVWIGQSGIVAHILAALTNESISPASTSITSGTSGCSADGVILNEKEQEVFVAVNMHRLSQEMAQGKGQYLQSLAGLMGCTSAVYIEFAEMTKDKYRVLFESGNTGTSDLLSGLRHEIATNPKLAMGCARVS